LKERRILASETPFADGEVADDVFSFKGTYSAAGGIVSGSYAKAECQGGDGTVFFCFVGQDPGLRMTVR
jgi:hypothetical protein